MRIAHPDDLLEGTLIRRYQRFLTEVRLDNRRVVVAHTPNTGSMMQCAVPGHRVIVSRAKNPARKLAYTLELVRVNGRWVDVHTHRSNRVVEEALLNNRVPGLEDWTVRREVGLGNSRIDFMLAKGRRKAWLEVKNVTLTCEPDVACFPDAVTQRGAKHLTDLMIAVTNGHRGIVMFTVQRREARRFMPADHIDPGYGRLLREAVATGVEVMAWKTVFRRPYVRLDHPIPVLL